MFFSRAILLLTLLCALASGRPTLHARSVLVLQSAVTLPAGFMDLGKAPGRSTIALKIHLAKLNSAQISAAFTALSDPLSPTYGQHPTEADLASAPSQANIDAVQSWLTSEGLKGTWNVTGAEIDVSTTVKTANKLLGANYHTYTNTADGVETVNTLKYSLPSSLADIVDSVSPTTDFPHIAAPSVGIVVINAKPDNADTITYMIPDSNRPRKPSVAAGYALEVSNSASLAFAA